MSTENKVCTNCLIEKPITEFHWQKKSNNIRHAQCRTCRNIARTIYREAHIEEEQLYSANYNKTHSDQVRKRHAIYRENHKEKLNAKNLAYNQGHREEQKAYSITYHKNHQDQTQAYQVAYHKAHPEKKRLYAANRRARKRSLPNTFTQGQRIFMLQYWHYVCAYCGNQEGFLWTLADDHFIPLSSPDCPGTIVENMLPACHSIQQGGDGCNTRKQDKNPSLWLIERFGKQKGLQIGKIIAVYFQIAYIQFSGATLIS